VLIERSDGPERHRGKEGEREHRTPLVAHPGARTEREPCTEHVKHKREPERTRCTRLREGNVNIVDFLTSGTRSALTGKRTARLEGEIPRQADNAHEQDDENRNSTRAQQERAIHPAEVVCDEREKNEEEGRETAEVAHVGLALFNLRASEIPMQSKALRHSSDIG
jgi:hypothetical protein